MSNRGWTRFASGASSRALKYRQLLDEALGLAGPELAVLALMMLRGPQTLGELKQRSERLHRFDSLPEVAQTLDGLAERELAVRLQRRPGQKEERYAHLLGEGGGEPPPEVDSPAAPDTEGDRVAQLDERLERLERGFDELVARLDNLPGR
jgi:uncharacterized protein YceH (UPF0502 family)